MEDKDLPVASDRSFLDRFRQRKAISPRPIENQLGEVNKEQERLKGIHKGFWDILNIHGKVITSFPPEPGKQNIVWKNLPYSEGDSELNERRDFFVMSEPRVEPYNQEASKLLEENQGLQVYILTKNKVNWANYLFKLQPHDIKVTFKTGDSTKLETDDMLKERGQLQEYEAKEEDLTRLEQAIVVLKEYHGNHANRTLESTNRT